VRYLDAVDVQADGERGTRGGHIQAQADGGRRDSEAENAGEVGVGEVAQGMCSRRRWQREHPGQQARRKMSGAAKTVIAPGHLSIDGESARRAAADPISLYPAT